MKSILDNRSSLHAAVWQVAETAGYLWEKGWAERNGGNITVNITEHVDDEMRAMPAISEPKPIGTVLPELKGCWFYCKGTQKRMRDLARDPMANGSIIRILDDCAHMRSLQTSQLHRHRNSRRISVYTTISLQRDLHTERLSIPILSNWLR